MRSKVEIEKAMQDRGDLELVFGDGISGGARFMRGPMKGMSVIWSCNEGWEHVSIDGRKRDPDWSEMCLLKNIFWREDETVVQYHPAKEHYVNNVEHCLHLWKPIERYAGALPVPPEHLIGIKALGTLK